jgi:hypothetical protein
MGIYPHLIDLTKLTMNALKSMVYSNKISLPTSMKKYRFKARVGQTSNAVAKRRRLNELAKQSRRINWQVAKGISIRG